MKTKKRSAGSNQDLCITDYPPIRYVAKDDGSTGARASALTQRNLSGSALPRGNARVRRRRSLVNVGGGLQELEETGYWLELLGEAGILREEHFGELRREVEELTAILVA